MNNAPVRVYKALIVMYPRGFRSEYGDDMVLVFSAQLRDESAWRVCARAVTDLVITVPTRHLEVAMKSSTSPFLTFFFGVSAVAGVVFAMVVGSNLALAAVGVVASLIAGAVSLVSYRRNRPIAPIGPVLGWWKFVGGGGAILAALIVVTNLTGELPEGFWLPTMLAGLTALVLMTIGMILGVTRLLTRSA